MPQYQQQNAAEASNTKFTRLVRRIVRFHAPSGTNCTHNTQTNQPPTDMRAPHTKVGGCAVTLHQYRTPPVRQANTNKSLRRCFNASIRHLDPARFRMARWARIHAVEQCWVSSNAATAAQNPTAPSAFGHLENAVMEILWTHGESNVHAVIQTLERPLAYTTVMTTLDRLFKKASWIAPTRG
jgi:hypothetical protein